MIVQKEKQAIKEISESNMIVHSRQRQEDAEFEATLGSEQIEGSEERREKHCGQSCALALHSCGMAAHLVFDQCPYNCLLVGF